MARCRSSTPAAAAVAAVAGMGPPALPRAALASLRLSFFLRRVSLRAARIASMCASKDATRGFAAASSAFSEPAVAAGEPVAGVARRAAGRA